MNFIAMNPQRGGSKGSASCLPLAEYDKLIAQPWLKAMVADIREGNNKLKGLLPFRAAHYGRFLKNHRSQNDADPTSFLFQTTIDIDDKELVDIAIEMARQLNCSYGIWKGALLHLEYSARKKLHIDIRMPIGMTIEETQRAYCEALGVPCDESCFSPERIIFITDKDSEIYRSPHWYEVLPAEEIQARREAYLKRGLTIDGRGKVSGGNFKFPQISQITQMHSAENPAVNNSTDFRPVRSVISQMQGKGNDAESVKSVGESQMLGTSENLCDNNLDRDSKSVKLNAHVASENEKSVKSVKSVGEPQMQGTSENLCDNNLDRDSKSVKLNTQVASENEKSVKSVKSVGEPPKAETPSEKSLIAFDLFVESAGLKGVAIDTEGSRHSSLLAIMSAGASRVMSEEELKKVVSVKMPSFAAEHDCQQLIHDFYAKYGDSSKPFSRDVIRVNAEAEKQAAKQQECSGLSTVNSLAAGEPDSPPALPEKLPRLVELLTSQTPPIYKAAVACAIFPPLATHLWQTTFPYIDGVDHEATLMCALLAGTGAGKSCVNMPINYIMADIRKRDLENLAREKAWKDEMTRKGANKDKRKRPEGLIIQEIDADMTNPAFVMRTAEAKGHFLYTTLNELDQFDALRGQGNQHFKIMCLAFDPGNIYGQTRVGLQSVTERVCIRFNWNASTTIHKGQRYFRQVLTDGPVSRINFCTIPEREIGAEMPVYGCYAPNFSEQLQPYIDNLLRASGRIECPEAYQLALRLKEENADYARMTQSRTYENLSFRANVIAYLKACVLYVANGYEWEPEMENFIRWSEQYDLWCKMRFFGDAIEKSETQGEISATARRGPRNLLRSLPDTFTLQDAISVRMENGLPQEGTRPMLNTWTHRGYIRRLENGYKGNDSNDNNSNDSFEKLKFRRDGATIKKNSQEG